MSAHESIRPCAPDLTPEDIAALLALLGRRPAALIPVNDMQRKTRRKAMLSPPAVFFEERPWAPISPTGQRAWG